MSTISFTEILPHGEGRSWGCGKDPVAGRRFIAVVVLLVWILIQFVVLFGNPNSCLLESKTQTGTSHTPLDLRNPVQTADHPLEKQKKQKYTSNKKRNSVETKKSTRVFSPPQRSS